MTIDKMGNKFVIMTKNMDLLLAHARNITSQKDLLHMKNIELKENDQMSTEIVIEII